MTLAELATSKLKLLQFVFVHPYLHVLLYRKPVLIVWGVPGKCRKSLGENGHLIQNYGGPHEKYGGPPQTPPKLPPYILWPTPSSGPRPFDDPVLFLGEKKKFIIFGGPSPGSRPFFEKKRTGSRRPRPLKFLVKIYHFSRPVTDPSRTPSFFSGEI